MTDVINMTQPTVHDMRVAYAQDGVEYAQQTFGGTLDYSEQSVRVVEDILAELHEASKPKGFIAKLLKQGPSEETINKLGKMLGGYVGEVMRKEWGGEWTLGSDAFPGEQVITLQLATGEDVWPHFKVGKRILNGPEDDVWSYFQLLKEST